MQTDTMARDVDMAVGVLSEILWQGHDIPSEFLS